MLAALEEMLSATTLGLQTAHVLALAHRDGQHLFAQDIRTTLDLIERRQGDPTFPSRSATRRKESNLQGLAATTPKVGGPPFDLASSSVRAGRGLDPSRPNPKGEGRVADRTRASTILLPPAASSTYVCSKGRIHWRQADPGHRCVSAERTLDRQEGSYARFSLFESREINASFFARDHRFNCTSRSFALRIVECSSAYTISTGRRTAV